MQSVRIIEIPACKMASSGVGMFGEEKFDRFDRWLSGRKRGPFPRDYLFWADTGFCWLYMAENTDEVPEDFELVDFPGGLYALATDIDQKTDREQMSAEVDAFIAGCGLERDPARQELGNIITPPSAQRILGYSQMDYYFPVRARGAGKGPEA